MQLPIECPGSVLACLKCILGCPNEKVQENHDTSDLIVRHVMVCVIRRYGTSDEVYVFHTFMVLLVRNMVYSLLPAVLVPLGPTYKVIFSYL